MYSNIGGAMVGDLAVSIRMVGGEIEVVPFSVVPFCGDEECEPAIDRRKLLAFGASILVFSTASNAGHAQPGFEDVAGEWEGYTTNDIRLNLIFSADGQFILRFFTGPAAGSIPRGRAIRHDGVVVLKYGDTEINLTKSADGKLVGPYATSRTKGVITFHRR